MVLEAQLQLVLVPGPLRQGADQIPVQPQHYLPVLVLFEHVKRIDSIGLSSTFFHLSVLFTVSHTEELNGQTQMPANVETVERSSSTQMKTEYPAALIAAARFRPIDYQPNGYASLYRRYHYSGILNLASLHLLAVRTFRWTRQLRVANDYLWMKTVLLAQKGLCHLNTACV